MSVRRIGDRRLPGVIHVKTGKLRSAPVIGGKEAVTVEQRVKLRRLHIHLPELRAAEQPVEKLHRSEDLNGFD